MAEYEVVREIQNSCSGNQMRDVFFDEVETDDPEGYVRTLLKGEVDELTVERVDDGNLTIFASSHGLRQKFLFTLI
ncbi:MAG: hypothetical protein IKF98_11085 [Clostridia bacterium]|nr:hypothetical protein [Clostridia bacterium]